MTKNLRIAGLIVGVTTFVIVCLQGQTTQALTPIQARLAVPGPATVTSHPRPLARPPIPGSTIPAGTLAIGGNNQGSLIHPVLPSVAPPAPVDWSQSTSGSADAPAMAADSQSASAPHSPNQGETGPDGMAVNYRVNNGNNTSDANKPPRVFNFQ